MTSSISPETDFTTSRHPREEEIPERYAVNAFDVAMRHLVVCECESMPCEHVAEYNRARVRLMDEIAALRSVATYDVKTEVKVSRADLVRWIKTIRHEASLDDNGVLMDLEGDIAAALAGKGEAKP